MKSTFKQMFVTIILALMTSSIVLIFHLNSRFMYGYFLLFEAIVMVLGIFIVVDALLALRLAKDKKIHKNLARIVRICIGLGIIITHLIVNMYGGYVC